MNRIKELRKERNLTQIQLSEILEIDQTTVSKWELGKAFPDSQTLKKLSAFFDVSIDYLLGNSTYYYPDQLAHADGVKSDEDREVLSLFHALTPEYQAVALNTLRSWAGVPAKGVSKKKA